MKVFHSSVHVLCFMILFMGMEASASEKYQPERFISPDQIPQTQYYIDVNINSTNNRLEGREEIQVHNSSKQSIKRLVIDWQYPNEEMKVVCEDKPVEILEKGRNGLSRNQTLIELPEAIERGESIELEVQFGLRLRLGNIAKLESWYPRLWWERDTQADYKVKIENTPKEYIVATSGVFDDKNNCYIAKRCRKFGLVFMKGLKVMKARSGDTEIYSYYDEGSRECVEFTHRTAADVIDFYRDWLGFYPHKILHIVPGGLSHPAGGYPIATGIVGIHGQKRMESAPKTHWQFITAHEIGHEYWMEHVLEAPNTFWLMIGLGVYADRAFMLDKEYGDKHERDMIGRYIRGARDMLDTRMNRLPEEMRKVNFDYNNVVNHGKGFGVISALACVMGKETFEAAYKRCLEEYQGRCLSTADFQRVCEEVSGEKLDWYFDQWVRSSSYLSYEIASHETSSKNGNYITTAKVKNLGTLRMPVPVTASFEDGSSQTLFTDRLLDECSLVFTSKVPLKEIKLDAQGELPLVIPPPDPVIAQLKKDLNRLDFTGKGDDALRIYNDIKNKKLDGVEFSWFSLGMHLYDEGHNQEALQAFKNDSKQNPDRFIGYVWQGHMHDLMNNRDEAVKSYNEALAMDPQSWVRHDQWGMKIDRSWIEKRIQSPFRRPDPQVIALKNRINNLEWTGDGDEALRIYKEIKKIKSDDDDLSWGKLGLCMYDGKHYQEALQVFKLDFEQNPGSFSSLVWQGHLLDLTNRREEALKCYKQALDMNPQSWVRHDQYGIRIDFDWIRERIKTPFQRIDAKVSDQETQQENSTEPGLSDVLKDMGYDESVIERPLSIGLFKAGKNPSVKILQKNGNASVTLGWYREKQKHPLFENFTGATSPKTFDPGKAEFGFYIDVVFQDEFEWFTEVTRNDGEAHVKVYPLVKEGKEIQDSYLLCWEDLALGMDIVDDYQDIIVHVSGVTPVTKKKFGSAYGDFPRLSFHIWGSTPFSSRLTSNPVNQNILFSIRKDPKPAEQIAGEVKASNEKVSTVLAELKKYDLVREADDSKWVTNFPIYTEEEIVSAHKIGLKYARMEADILRDHIPVLKETYERCGVSKTHPWSEASLIVVGALCADFCVSDRIRFKPEYFDEKFLPPLHRDGKRWGYTGEEVLSSPVPFRRYQFYQNVFANQEGGITRFGYFYILEEDRKSPPSRPESLCNKSEGKIWLSLTKPLTIGEIERKTGLSPEAVRSAIDKMSGWNPPGLKKENDKYIATIPILSEEDLSLLLPEVDRLGEMIFKQITIPMEEELEEKGKELGLRFPLPPGTSARDIALQILGEEGLLPIAQPPVPWSFGVWGWNGHLKMWEDVK